MLLVFIINTFVIALAVMLHFEMLSRLSILMPRLTIRYRFRIAVGIFGALIAHIMEVWLFAFAYFWTTAFEETGEIWSQLLFLACFTTTLRTRLERLSPG